MKKYFKKKNLLSLALLLMAFFSVNNVFAQLPQNPPPPPPGQNVPPPGANPPPPGNPGLTPPPGQTPPSPGQVPPPPPPGWGSPGYLASPPAGDWMNQGYLNVMATGYDTQGVLQQIPLYVSYAYNGAYYNVTVLNSWNPYTQMWNQGVDAPAVQTTYYLNGFTYNYYVNLPSGTFYFNL